MITPRLVAIDSSLLGKMSIDRFSSDSNRRQRYDETIQRMVDSCVVPTLSWTHIEELIRDQNEQRVEQKISLIRSFPMVASPKELVNGTGVGSILDILGRELETAYRNPGFTALDVAKNLGSSIFWTGSGAELIATVVKYRPVLSKIAQGQAGHQREVVAISRSGFNPVSKTTISDLRKGKLRSPEMIELSFQNLAAKLSRDIEDRGDKRIPNPQATAINFMNKARSSIGEASLSKDNPADDILLQFGFEPNQISGDQTLGELGDMLVFWKQAEVACKNLDLEVASLKKKVDPLQVPSWKIKLCLREHGQDQPERKGSDLGDAELMCLAPYCDVLFVDKRTSESLGRASRKDQEFSRLTSTCRKVGQYNRMQFGE